MAALCFALPLEELLQTKVVLELITAVPSDWSCVDGQLERKASAKSIAANLGLKICSNRGVTVYVREPCEQDAAYRHHVFNQPVPQFIFFEEAGRRPSHPSLEACKQISSECVIRGYRGWLTFKNDYDEFVRMMQLYLGKAFARVNIVADLQDKSRSDIAHILDVCASFNLIG